MKFLILIMLLIPAISIAQFNVNGPGNLTYEKIFQVNSSKSEIKSKVEEWVAKTYNDPKEVTVLNSEDKIFIRPLFKIHPEINGYSIPMSIFYTLSSEFKEGRYKITVDDIKIDNSTHVMNEPLPDFEEYKIQVEKSLPTLPKDAKKQMEKILKDEGKVLKMYNESVGNQRQILNLIQSYIENNIVENLTDYVETENKETAW